jgi:pimeloyl-ACP methyl ester carboxylesterase
MLLAMVLLTGCGSLLLSNAARAPDGVQAGAGAGVDLLPSGVEGSRGRIASSTGCALKYSTFAPANPAGASTDWVILAHGFLRSQARMRDLATRMAQDGLYVATLDFCNQKPWAGRHVQNSHDMLALAHHLGARRVVYAGFSAGGLAALLAAREDRRTVGVLTLDLVDAGGLGLGAARALDKPLLAIAGEPANCNAEGNGAAVYAASRVARVERIAGASHCDFESPTDGLCELVCADPDGGLGAQRRRIIDSASRAALALLGDGERADWPRDEPQTAGR